MLIDARNLPDGRVVVLTTAGAGLYDPAFRRWLPLAMPGGKEDSRIEVIGDHLVRIDGAHLRSIPLASIAQVPSCQTSTVPLTWAIDLVARAVTMFQIAIAVAAISALTKRRKYWVLSMILGLAGTVFLVLGLLAH